MGVVGVAGGHPDWAVALAGVYEDCVCVGLGWARSQHPSVHKRDGAGGRTE